MKPINKITMQRTYSWKHYLIVYAFFGSCLLQSCYTSSTHVQPEIVKKNEYIEKKDLHGAASSGDLEAVQYLIEKEHLDPNGVDKYNRQPLHLAVQYGHLQVVKYLIEQAHVDKESANHYGNGKRPLHIAAEYGQVDIAQYLIEKAKADPESRTPFDKRPLHVAAEYGQLPVAKYLVEEVQVDKEALNTAHNENPLHTACVSGRLEVVQYLIEVAKVNKEAKNRFKRGAVWHAAAGGNLATVKYLIEKANLTQELTVHSDYNPLFIAALAGKLDVVKYLVKEAQMDPTINDQGGSTALHQAAFTGEIKIIKWLVEKANVAPLPLDKYGTTPLDVAKKRKHQQVVDYLQQFVKEKPTATLHEAALAGDLSLVQQIVDSGTSVQLTTPTNQTALHYVALAEKPNLAVAEWLLQQGISINVLDDQGNTALSLAIERGHVDLVKLLIQAGASLNFKHSNGWSLLHLAAYHGHIALVKYLVEEIHMSPMCINKQGESPLDVAIARSQTEVVAYLKELLVKSLQDNQEAIRMKLSHQLGTELQDIFQPLNLGISSGWIKPQNFADLCLESMKNALQGNLIIPPTTSREPNPKIDECLEGMQEELQKHLQEIPEQYREMWQKFPVDSLRPYVTSLVEEVEKGQWEEEYEQRHEQKIEKIAQENSLQAQQNVESQPIEIPDRGAIANSSTIGQVNVENKVICPIIFVPSTRQSNIKRIKRYIRDIKEELSGISPHEKLSIEQQTYIEGIFTKLQHEQKELVMFYRDMKTYMDQRVGYSPENATKAKQFLLDIQVAKEELLQIAINHRVSFVDYISNGHESNFENDYSDQELKECFNSCGEAPHTNFRTVFVEAMRMKGKKDFELIMKKLGTPAPVSIQDFIELLDHVPQFAETISAHNPTLKKEKEDLAMLEQRVKYISQIILRTIIQSTPYPRGKTIQVTSLPEIKKRILKLTIAIERKLRQTILQL